MSTSPTPPGDAGPDSRAGVSFLGEARRRGVARVATSYAVIAWLLIQIASTTFGPLGVPEWMLTTLIVIAFVGFPIACVLAWFFELTPHGIERDAAPPQAIRPTVGGVRRYADVAIIGVLVVAVAVLLVRQRQLEHSLGLENPALAVMPFVNMSGDPAQEFFSDGIAEELIGRLGSVPGLKVTARSSSFALKGRNLDPQAIAGKLGVNAILEGTVRRSGELLRLSASLVDAHSGFQLWSASYERKPAEIFDIQDEITRAVAAAVLPEATPPPTTKLREPTADLKAHEFYLLGVADRWQRNPEALDRAIGYFEKAIASDPNFAQAHAALARSIILRHFQTEVVDDPNNAAVVRAEKEVYKALSLDPSLAETQGALGTLLWRTGRPGSTDVYERALRINPNDTTVLHDYAVSIGNDDVPKSQELNRRTLELDPLAAVTRSNYLQGMVLLGQIAEFERESKHALELYGDDKDALQLIASSDLAIGQLSAAYRAGKKQLALEEFRLVNFWVIACHLLVDPAEALQLLEAARAQSKEPSYSDFIGAAARFLLGDNGPREERVRHYLAENPDDKELRDTLGFMHVVQGRYAEAATELTSTYPVHDSGGGFGAFWRQGMPARLLAFRKTGREREARELLEFYKQRVLPSAAAQPGCHYCWTTIAAVESVEGRKDAAIKALRSALKSTEFPTEFQPVLPWFTSLEGHPGYAEVLAERAARIEQIKANFAHIDAELAGTAGQSPAGS